MKTWRTRQEASEKPDTSPGAWKATHRQVGLHGVHGQQRPEQALSPNPSPWLSSRLPRAGGEG